MRRGARGGFPRFRNSGDGSAVPPVRGPRFAEPAAAGTPGPRRVFFAAPVDSAPPGARSAAAVLRSMRGAEDPQTVRPPSDPPRTARRAQRLSCQTVPVSCPAGRDGTQVPAARLGSRGGIARGPTAPSVRGLARAPDPAFFSARLGPACIRPARTEQPRRAADRGVWAVRQHARHRSLGGVRSRPAGEGSCAPALAASFSRPAPLHIRSLSARRAMRDGRFGRLPLVLRRQAPGWRQSAAGDPTT